MARSPEMYIWDAIDAAKKLVKYQSATSLELFLVDDIIQGAAERRFEIIGEVLKRLHRLDPAIRNRVPHFKEIVGMRDIIAHDYYAIDYELMWETMRDDIEPLIGVLTQLLGNQVQPPVTAVYQGNSTTATRILPSI